MPKGSVVYFHHGVWHWQGDRTEAGERVTIHSHFNRGILRSLEPKKTDVQMLHRNPPRLAEMLGEIFRKEPREPGKAAGGDHRRQGQGRGRAVLIMAEEFEDDRWGWRAGQGGASRD